MEGKRVSAEELKWALAADFDRLAEEIAEAMNAAKDGRQPRGPWASDASGGWAC